MKSYKAACHKHGAILVWHQVDDFVIFLCVSAEAEEQQEVFIVGVAAEVAVWG